MNTITIDSKIIGSRIQKRRSELGLTQKDLAELTDFQQSEISRFERGMYKPKVDSLAKLAIALNVSIDWLLGLSEEKDRR